MKIQDIINDVRKKIKNIELINREEIVNYLDARDLLLNEGFINFYNEEIKKVYWELFSDNKYFEEKHKTVLHDIQSKDTSTRLNASKKIAKEPYEEYSNFRKFWLKDPRTIDILLHVLENEKEEEILLNLVNFFGQNAIRYSYDDINIFEKIIIKYDKVSNKGKITIASNCLLFPTEKKWNYVLDAIKLKPYSEVITKFDVPLLISKKEIPNDLRKEILNNLAMIAKQSKGIKLTNKSVQLILNLVNKNEKQLLEDLRTSIDTNNLGDYTNGALNSKIYEIDIQNTSTDNS